MFFMGEYNHTIDAKGRVSVPSKLREPLGEGFVITKGLDGCLFMYEAAEWEKFEERISSLPMNRAEVRTITRFFLAGADKPEYDKMGRILIPQPLRNHAGLTKDVVFLGVGKRIEIWDKEKWEQCDLGDMDEVAAKLEEIGLDI